MRTVGAVVRGIRTPIVREGDDLVTLVRDSVMAASETEHITFHDRDIVAVTESVVARAAGNYATVQNIADDVKAKFGCDHIGVIFPILSRNRFAIVLRGIATGMKRSRSCSATLRTKSETISLTRNCWRIPVSIRTATC